MAYNQKTEGLEQTRDSYNKGWRGYAPLDSSAYAGSGTDRYYTVVVKGKFPHTGVLTYVKPILEAIAGPYEGSYSTTVRLNIALSTSDSSKDKYINTHTPPDKNSDPGQIFSSASNGSATGGFLMQNLNRSNYTFYQDTQSGREDGLYPVNNIEVTAGQTYYFYFYANTKPSSDQYFVELKNPSIYFIIKEKESPTVTLNANGGKFSNGSQSISLKMKPGTSKTYANPIRNGYDLTGWSISPSNGGSYSISGGQTTFTCNKQVTFTAQWKKQAISYEVILNPNGGTFSGNSGNVKLTISQGSSQTYNNPTRNGYQLTSWLVSPAGEGTASISGTKTTFKCSQNVTFTAQWKASSPSEISYNVTLDAGGGTFSNGRKTISYVCKGSSNVTKTEKNPTRSGYTFNGWTVSPSGYGTASVSNGSTKFTCNKKGNVVFSANWKSTVQVYTILIDANKGVFSDGAHQYRLTMKPGESVTKYAPTRENYKFSKWIKQGPGTATMKTGWLGSTTFTCGTGNNTFLAEWLSNPKYTVKINPNGGSINGSTQTITLTMEANDRRTYSNPVRDGYIFDGWTVSPSNGGSVSSGFYNSSVFTCKGNVTFTAKWKSVYTVVIDANGGSFGNETQYSTTATQNQQITHNNPTKHGYKISGWTVSPSSAGSYQLNGSQTIFTCKGNVTFTAKWTNVPLYTITIKGEGGEFDKGVPDLTFKLEAGESITFSNPTRVNYKLINWSVDPSANGTITKDNISGKNKFTCNGKGNAIVLPKWESTIKSKVFVCHNNQWKQIEAYILKDSSWKKVAIHSYDETQKKWRNCY